MRIGDLLQAGESKTLDFKLDLSSKKGIVKDIIAFANTSGGRVIIGIDPKSLLPIGLEDPLGDEEKLAQMISDNIEPQLIPDIGAITYEGKELLVLTVPHVIGPVHLKDKGPDEGVYIRIGSTSRAADPPMVEELRRLRTNRTFDQLPCPLTTDDDLSSERLHAAFDPVGIEVSEAKKATLDLLVDDGAGNLIPSNGGIIAFGTEPLKAFPDAQLRCARFRGTTKAVILNHVDMEGTLLEAIEEAEAFIDQSTQTAAEIKGIRRKNIPEYSELIVREVLVNAVAHADYSVVGSNILVSIFEDRMEIQNPGMWPFGITIEQLKAGQSKIRNRVLVGVLRRTNFMERLGSGYERIQSAMEEGYPEPEWEEVGTSVRVALRPHPHFKGEIASPSRKDRKPEIAKALRGGPLSPKEIAAEIGVGVRQVQRYLSDMQSKGEVELLGKSRTDPRRKYQLPGP